MVTRDGMLALRRAATLAHVLPTLRVRLRVDQRVLFEVTRGPGSDAMTMHPCEFRAAVVRAHRHMAAGSQLAFRNLPVDAEPAIDIGVGPGGAAFPGGIYRIDVDGTPVHAFATTLSARACRRAVDDLRATDLTVHLRHDVMTDITIVHAIDSGSPTNANDPTAAPEMLEDLLARFAVDELLRELATARP